MASIYTARSIAGSEKTTPLFNLKGLSNHAPSTVSNLNIQGVSLERQLAYTQYAHNIASFITAAITKKIVTVSSRPLGIPTLSRAFQTDPPPLSFTLMKALDSDRADKLVHSLGPGASRTVSGKTMIFTAPSLPIGALEPVITISTPFFNAGRDAVNPRGMRAFLLLETIIGNFLKVHTYSAFRTEDDGSMTEFAQLMGGDRGALYFQKTTTSKNKEGVEEVKERDVSFASYAQVERTVRNSAGDMDVDDKGIDMTEYQGYFRFSGYDSVMRAKPPKENIENIGSAGSVPSSPGLVFPYFHGLIQPDASYMNGILLRRFYQLLGSNHETCQENYVNIRHGINSLASTQRGMELCHMLLGIDLALDTQSRCFVIMDRNRYQGFALLGARFAMFANTKWVKPCEEEQVREALSRMDPHEAAMADMIKKLQDLKASNIYEGATSPVIFSDPEVLVGELAKLKVSDMEEDDVRDLDRYLRNLNYMGTSYLVQNPQAIADVLATLKSHDYIPLTRPTYLPTIRAPFDSRSFRALSRFGPEAPSFWNDRGSEITCKPVERSIVLDSGKRKLGEDDIYGNMPVKLLITPKPLLIAVKDMDKVISNGKVKMDVSERAGKYRNVCVEHEETRKLIWRKLIDVCSVQTKKVKLDNGEKANRDQESIDEALLQLLG